MSKKYIVVMTVVMVLGLVFIGKRLLHPRAASDNSPTQTYDDVLKVDRAILSDKNSSGLQIYNSLVRLSQVKDPSAAPKAKEFAKSTIEWARAGAAEAFGYIQNHDSDLLLKELLADKSPLVRKSAIRAMGLTRTAARKAILVQAISSNKLSTIEEVEAKASLLKYFDKSKEANEISKNIHEILLLADKIEDKKEMMECFTLIEAIAIQSKNQEVEKYIHKALQQGSDPGLRAYAVRHLATYSTDEFRKEIGPYTKDKQPEVRLAATQSLILTCPIERFNILRRVLETENDIVIWSAAGQDLLRFPRRTSLDIAHNLQGLQLPTAQKEELAKLVDQLQAKSDAQDPCALRYPEEFKGWN
jgi:HEAT repeat protein